MARGPEQAAKKSVEAWPGGLAAELASADAVRQALRAIADPARVPDLRRFFKTGPGEYAEGDEFLGVTVPAQRKIAKAARTLPEREVLLLLRSSFHEERLTALLIWVEQFSRAEAEAGGAIVRAYLKNTRWVNNWDLVDSSASQLLGKSLLASERKVLYQLAASKMLWERRIAIIATHAFLGAGESEDALQLCERLLGDTEDLMHKAVGWTLREVGKRVSPEHLRAFLREHATTMPRTALRYAIEHFSPEERARWLAKKAKRGSATGPRPTRR
jgi:3-methyladenine DNA glycosylase AlkD